ncbi:MAG: hypothetical protein ACE5IK_06485 [Acidobacteriota bacterium]
MSVEPSTLLVLKSASGFVASLGSLVVVLSSHERLLARQASRWGILLGITVAMALMALIFHDVMATENRGLNFYVAGIGFINFLTALICHLWFWYSRHRALAAS